MNLKLVLLLSALSAVISAKNVVNLDKFNREVDDQAHVKRDPKNVINLAGNGDIIPPAKRDDSATTTYLAYQDKRDDVVPPVKRDDVVPPVKRDDVVPPVKRDDVVPPVKREPKNIVNLDNFNVDEQDHAKRQPKNIVNLGKFQHDVEEQSHTKREAKNVFVFTEYKPVDSKREEPNQVYFKINEADCHQNILQSILPQLKDISIMTGYIRDNGLISSKTELTNETTLIIAPSDDAIINKLQGKKPWEFPQPIDGANGDENAERNLDNFVFGHVVENFEQNLRIEQLTVLTQLINGNSLRIKQDVTHKFQIQLNEEKWIDVKQVKQVDNGFVFIIEDSLVKP